MSLDFKSLVAPHIKKVTYIEVDAISVSTFIETFIKENVPEIKTFCPEGWSYDQYNFLNPVVSLFLGENKGSDRFYTKWRPDLDDSEDWILKININGLPTKQVYGTKTVEVIIPYFILETINDAIFGDLEKVQVYWNW